MSIIIFVSASKQIFFCRNDVQAIDFVRKGSYASDIIKDHQTNVLCILHVGKNVRVKLEKKIIISCNLGTLLFYTLISSNTTLRYMFAQGRKNEHRPLLCHSVASRRGTKRVYGLNIYVWVADIRTNDLRTNEPSD